MRKLEIGSQRVGAKSVHGERVRAIELDFETFDVVEGADHQGVWGKGPLPFPDDTFTEIYASHVLEHVPWFHTVAALKEALRVLTPGGMIEIWVPNAEWIVRHWLESRCGDLWRRFNPENDPTLWAAGRLLAYGPGEENWHRALLSPDHLLNCLEQAGFVHVARKMERTRGDRSHGEVDLGMVGYKPGLPILDDEERSYREGSYWETRYHRGGNSGAGSRGPEAGWKIRQIVQWVRKTGSKSILDFGCGDGFVAMELLRQLPEVTYLGLDISSTIVASNQDKALQHGYADRARFIACDVSAPWRGGSSDCVLNLDVLFHIREDRSFDQLVANIKSSATKVALVCTWNEAVIGSRWLKGGHVFYRPFPYPEGRHNTVVPAMPNKTLYVLTGKDLK